MSYHPPPIQVDELPSTVLSEISQTSHNISTSPTPHHAVPHYLDRAEAYTQACALLPPNTPAYQSAAANAIADAHQAAAIDPHLPAAWLALFAAYSVSDQPAFAHDALRQGMSHCPHDSSLRFASLGLSSATAAQLTKLPSRHQPPPPHLHARHSSTPIVGDLSVDSLSVLRHSDYATSLPSPSATSFHVPSPPPPPPSSPPPPPPPPLRPTAKTTSPTSRVKRLVQNIPRNRSSREHRSVRDRSSYTSSGRTPINQPPKQSAYNSPTRAHLIDEIDPSSFESPISHRVLQTPMPQSSPPSVDRPQTVSTPTSIPSPSTSPAPPARSVHDRVPTPIPQPPLDTHADTHDDSSATDERFESVEEGGSSHDDDETQSSDHTAAAMKHAHQLLLDGSYDESIQEYTAILNAITSKADKQFLICLCSRSTVWLQKALDLDDRDCFAMAVRDAQEVVRRNPKWDEGWIRLGTAHLENGCPARARDAFEKALEHCPTSHRLLEGLRNSMYVIASEGAESDWENSDEEFTSSGSASAEAPYSPARVSSVGAGTRGRRSGSLLESRDNPNSRSAGSKQLPRMASQRSANSRHSSRRESPQQPPEQDRTSFSMPAESHQKFYDLLQVPRDASEASIKRSYYRLARECHPDKNMGDETATDKFQKLAEAYRVLSDPQSRAMYDRYGDKGLVKNSVDMIDPSTLFAMVFGSDQFIDIIGELQLASLASNIDESGVTPGEDVLNEFQRARVGKLVLEMIKTLKPWVDGDKKGFLSSTHRRMRKLKEASFGPSLLYTVGNAYVLQTSYLMDKGRSFSLGAMVRKASLRSHKVSSQYKAMNAAGRVMDKQRKLHDRVMKTGRGSRFISDEEARNIAIDMATNAIDMMWKISVIDIESTLEDVLTIVLSGRDLVAEGEDYAPDQNDVQGVKSKKGRSRSRKFSQLGVERSDSKERSKDKSDAGDFPNLRQVAPLSHGEAAVTRLQILSERALGIQAMGRIFMSALR